MSTISNTITHGITLGATYTSPLTITASGAVATTAVDGDAIYAGSSYANPTVVNYGTIEATGTNFANGLRFRDGGSVGNHSGGLIEGNANGVYITGASGTVTNSGTIASAGANGFGVHLRYGGSVQNSGLIEGATAVLITPGIGYTSNFSAALINTGTIIGASTVGRGVEFDVGGSIDNSGLIEAAQGIYIAVAAGTVINTGTIRGMSNFAVEFQLGGGSITNNAGGVIESVTQGVMVTGSAGTVVNSGAIISTFTMGAGVYLSNGGSVRNDADGLVEGGGGVLIFGTAATVINFGTIDGTHGAGVSVTAGSICSIGNLGTTSLIEGRLYGARVYASGGTLSNAGTIIGTTGAGVYLGNGGSVRNDAGATIAGASGVKITGAAGTVANAGSIVATATDGIGVDLSASGTVVSTGSTIIDSGTISGSTAIIFGGSASNLLVLQAGYHLVGAVAGGVSAADTLELSGSLGALTVNYNALSLSSFEVVRFGARGSETLVVSNVGGGLPVTISGFVANTETIDLTQIGTDGTISSNDTVADRITITGSLGSLTLQFDSIDGQQFTTSSDGTLGTDLTPVCYCRGTMVLTPTGEVPIEDLAIGNKVMTLAGAARPVKWIGRRAYDGRFIARNPAVLPVRIMAGALADGVPARDLLVSPEHSLYIDGVLVAACHLLNGATITQETRVEQLEYFHIELETHDIIIANSAPAESYVECDNRGRFHNAAEFAARYPGDDRPKWQFCASLLQWESEEPNAIREALMQRAESLGHTLDLDSDLHVVVDGAIVRPASVDGRVYRFAIPAGGAAASLASRRAVPAEVRATARDLRRLGVPVERLVLYDADLLIEASHGHAGLTDGFHGDEPSHRWTDGLAHLPESWLRAFPDEFTLEVHLIPSDLPYRLPHPARTRAVA